MFYPAALGCFVPLRVSPFILWKLFVKLIRNFGSTPCQTCLIDKRPPDTLVAHVWVIKMQIPTKYHHIFWCLILEFGFLTRICSVRDNQSGKKSMVAAQRQCLAFILSHSQGSPYVLIFITASSCLFLPFIGTPPRHIIMSLHVLMEDLAPDHPRGKHVGNLLEYLHW